MDKKKTKKLALHRETLQQLNQEEMGKAVGASEESFCWSWCYSCLCPLTQSCKTCGPECE